MRNTCKDTLYEKVFAGFCEEKDAENYVPLTLVQNEYGRITSSDYTFKRENGNILEIEIGPFADFNISIEEQERMGITGEVFEDLLREVDFKREKLIRYWKSLVMEYLIEVKGFTMIFKQYNEWIEGFAKEYENNPEWTIGMYEWALKFLRIIRVKLIKDVVSKSLNKKEE